MNAGNKIRIQTVNQRVHETHDMSRAWKAFRLHTLCMYMMEAIYRYPDFDSADRNKDSL